MGMHCVVRVSQACNSQACNSRSLAAYCVVDIFAVYPGPVLDEADGCQALEIPDISCLGHSGGAAREHQSCIAVPTVDASARSRIIRLPVASAALNFILSQGVK